MLTLLDRANNGNEMLAILDSFSNDSAETMNQTGYGEPTMNQIDFWYSLWQFERCPLFSPSAPLIGYITFVQSICDMNTDFFKPFLHTLVMNVLTIVAFVVAVTMYAYRAARVWYANGGKEFLINTAANLAAGVNKLSEKIYYILEDAEYAWNLRVWWW